MSSSISNLPLKSDDSFFFLNRACNVKIHQHILEVVACERQGIHQRILEVVACEWQGIHQRILEVVACERLGILFDKNKIVDVKEPFLSFF